jgi:hypothetical protein
MKRNQEQKTAETLCSLFIQKHKNLNSNIIEHFIQRKISILKDQLHIQRFFNKFYDHFYLAVILKEIQVERKTIRLLEKLAIPNTKKS